MIESYCIVHEINDKIEEENSVIRGKLIWFL